MNKKHFIHPEGEPNNQKVPVLASKLMAGFPSPAEDFEENKLDLNAYLVKRPSATIFAWVKGDSLIEKDIHSGDLIVIDRSIEPKHNMLVVAALDGAFCCKIYDEKRGQLLSANDEYTPIDIKGREDVLIEGVITHSIKRHI